MTIKTDLDLNGHGVQDRNILLFKEKYGYIRILSDLNIAGETVYNGTNEMFSFKNGNMKLHTNLNLNGHRLRSLIQHLHGILNTNDGKYFPRTVVKK